MTIAEIILTLMGFGLSFQMGSLLATQRMNKQLKGINDRF